MIKEHENYKELVLRLAKTDFKLRYHGSFLGYAWVILKPLLMFTVLNFVFSTIFNFHNSGSPFYPLELLTALLLFQFFAEGTMNGMTSLVTKAQLVTKIYVPRWTIVLASTINALFVFSMNLIVLFLFFILYGKIPSLMGILMFFVYAILLYVLIVAFAFLTSTLYVRFRDLVTIWEVLLSVLLYASPIIYTITLMPERIQNWLLVNPLAFIINYSKEGLISNNFTKPIYFSMLFTGTIIILLISIMVYKKYEKKVAELM